MHALPGAQKQQLGTLEGGGAERQSHPVVKQYLPRRGIGGEGRDCRLHGADPVSPSRAGSALARL